MRLFTLRAAMALFATFLVILDAGAQPSGPTRLDPLGDPLPAGAVARLGSLRLKHHPWVGVRTAKYSPDGKRIASASIDGRSIAVWDAATGKKLHRYLLPTGSRLFAVAFSPDSTVLAAGIDNEILLWDVASGQGLDTLRGHEDAVLDLGFADGGQTLVSASMDSSVRWWDVAGGKLRRVWEPFAGEQRAAQNDDKPFRVFADAVLAPDAQTLAVTIGWRSDPSQSFAARATAAIVFDLAAGTERWRLTGQHSALPFAFSPDGARLATLVSQDLQLRDTLTGKHLASCPLSNSAGLEFRGMSRDGPVWHLRHFPWKGPLAFSPDGTTVAILGGRRGVGLWNLDDTTTLHTLAGRFAEVSSFAPTSVAFSPDSKTLLLGVESTLQTFDVATGKERPSPLGHYGPVNHLTFFDDGKQLLSASGRPDPEEVLSWEVASWKQTRRSLLGTAGLFPLMPSFDHSTYIRHAGPTNDYAVFDGTSEQLLRPLDLPYPIYRHQLAGYSPNGRLFAVHVWDGQSSGEVLYEVASGKLLCRFPEQHSGRAWAFSPDDKLVALFPRCSAAVHIYETATGKLVQRLGESPQPLFEVASLAFSPDGRQLASWHGAENAVRLWDLNTGKERFWLPGKNPEERYTEPVCLAWSPDGHMLAVGGMANEAPVQVWEASSRKLRDAAASFGQDWRQTNVLVPPE